MDRKIQVQQWIKEAREEAVEDNPCSWSVKSNIGVVLLVLDFVWATIIIVTPIVILCWVLHFIINN